MVFQHGDQELRAESLGGSMAYWTQSTFGEHRAEVWVRLRDTDCFRTAWDMARDEHRTAV